MLIQLLVAVIVIGLIYWLLSFLPSPQPFKNIVTVIFVVICIIWLLSFTGMLGGPYWGTHPSRLP